MNPADDAGYYKLAADKGYSMAMYNLACMLRDGRGMAADPIAASVVLSPNYHSGRHMPDGSLIIFNSNTSHNNNEVVDYLEYTPVVLNFFGINPKPHMLKPTFTI